MTSAIPPLPYNVPVKFLANYEKVEYPMLELQILALQSDGPRRSKLAARFRRGPKRQPSEMLTQFLLS